ncbi:TPA: DUF2304 domain-containing protein, partial [Streptococcus pyogenes]|nr:DUF2304 domain-containing protein [Streptococcus pyogenes]HEQ9289756.1 DUF2304 domain-containing protein [Streptococcus pyogenes]
MTVTASLFISFIVLTFVFFLINLIKKDKLAIKYSLLWFILALLILLFTWLPNILNKMSHFLGIHSPTNMLFFLGFCLSLAI